MTEKGPKMVIFFGLILDSFRTRVQPTVPGPGLGSGRTSTQCGNYRNLLSHISDKNFNFFAIELTEELFSRNIHCGKYYVYNFQIQNNFSTYVMTETTT